MEERIIELEKRVNFLTNALSENVKNTNEIVKEILKLQGVILRQMKLELGEVDDLPNP